MDLDFKSVKALASPTRLEILNECFEGEATTTKISNNLNKSKSTVSNHLKKLTDSGLLEKDEVEGRKRVVYKPTSKAEAIVKGREEKVRFSVISTAFTSLAGVVFLSLSAFTRFSSESSIFEQDSAEPLQREATEDDMGLMMDEATQETVNQTASEGLVSSFASLEYFFLFIALGMFSLSTISILYGYFVNRITHGVNPNEN